MSTTTQIGNLKVKIGEYANKKTGKQSPLTLTIGKLMMTDDSDGTRRFWGKGQLHLLHASLYALVKPFVDKGDTEFTFKVYLDEDRPAPANGQTPAPAPAAMDDDEIEF